MRKATKLERAIAQHIVHFQISFGGEAVKGVGGR